MKEYTINPITREIKPVRKDAALGVYSDNGTDGAFFTLTGDIVKELTTYNSRVNFINFGEENVEVGDITDVNISGDTLTCSWILDRRATNSVGQIVFNLCFTKSDGKEWNTTVFKDSILEGLEPTLTEEEEQQLGSYYDMLVKQLDEEADRKKQEVLDSIPADYKELQNQISRQNESITEITEGTKQLFNKVSANVVNLYNNPVSQSANVMSVIVPINVGYEKKVTIHRDIKTSRFRVDAFTEYPTVGMASKYSIANNDAEQLTIQVDKSIKYLLVLVYHKVNDSSIAIKDVLDDLMVQFGNSYTGYENYIVPVGTKNLEKIITSESKTIGFEFMKKENNPIIDIPNGETDIGLISVMDVRDLPISNKSGNVYMWASPHDGGTFSVNAKSGIFLYTANNPFDEWTYRGCILSTAQFNAHFGATSAHISSPDVVWDETIGKFRIYFHANVDYILDGSGEVGQRTYLAYSLDGQSIESYETTDLKKPVIPLPKNGDIDWGTSDYARFIRLSARRWATVYSASTENGPTGIGFALSDDDGKFFDKRMRNWLIGGVDGYGYAGVPSVLVKDDMIYIAYFSYGNKGFSNGYDETRGIQLAELHDDGSIVRIGCVLHSPNDYHAWDSLRICASYLLEYDGDLYLFYSGRPRYNADGSENEQGKWPGTKIGVAVCKGGAK